MSEPFFQRPILNSPYEAPAWHHPFDDTGQPTGDAPIPARRRSDLITPVPRARKTRRKSQNAQAEFVLGGDDQGLSTEAQEYNPTPIINEIRQYLDAWRALPNPDQWNVTPATQRLLRHWRTHTFQGFRPFFCQREAVETIIWLTEVAPKTKKTGGKFWAHIKGAN
jgi:type III restriction enzyme